MNDIPTNNSNPQEDNTSVNLDKIEKMIQNVLSAPSKENQAKINSILFHTNLNSLVSLFYEAVINKKFKGKETSELSLLLFIQRVLKQKKKIEISEIFPNLKIFYLIILNSSYSTTLFNKKSILIALSILKKYLLKLDNNNLLVVCGDLLKNFKEESKEISKIKPILMMLKTLLLVQDNRMLENFNSIAEEIFDFLKFLFLSMKINCLCEKNELNNEIITILIEDILFFIGHTKDEKNYIDYEIKMNEIIVFCLKLIASNGQKAIEGDDNFNLGCFLLHFLVKMNRKYQNILFVDFSITKGYHTEIIKNIVQYLTKTKEVLESSCSYQQSFIGIFSYLSQCFSNPSLISQYQKDIYDFTTLILFPVINSCLKSELSPSEIDQEYFFYLKRIIQKSSETTNNNEGELLQVTVSLLKMIVNKYNNVDILICNYISNIMLNQETSNEILIFSLFILCALSSHIQKSETLSTIILSLLNKKFPLILSLPIISNNSINPLHVFVCITIESFLLSLYSNSKNEFLLLLSFLYENVANSNYCVLSLNALIKESNKNQNSSLLESFIDQHLLKIVTNVHQIQTNSYLNFIISLVKTKISKISKISEKINYYQLIFEKISEKIFDELSFVTLMYPRENENLNMRISKSFHILRLLFDIDPENVSYYYEVESIICSKLAIFMKSVQKIKHEDDIIDLVICLLDKKKDITNGFLFNILTNLPLVIKKNKEFSENIFELINLFLIRSNSEQKKNHCENTIIRIYKKEKQTISKDGISLNLMMGSYLLLSNDIKEQNVYEILHICFKQFSSLSYGIVNNNESLLEKNILEVTYFFSLLSLFFSGYIHYPETTMSIINKNNSFDSFIEIVKEFITSLSFSFPKMNKMILISLCFIINHLYYPYDTVKFIYLAFILLSRQQKEESLSLKEKNRAELEKGLLDEDYKEKITKEQYSENYLEMQKLVDKVKFHELGFDEFMLFKHSLGLYQSKYPDEFNTNFIMKLNEKDKITLESLLHTTRVKIIDNHQTVLFQPRKIVTIIRPNLMIDN